ncbi:MAG: hypothetical protein AB7U98_12245 [Candidatus Nitrosocosmicus sp.]
MNKSNIQIKRQKKNATVYATISVMVAFALIASPFLSAINDAYALSQKEIEQLISQYQDNDQDSQCVSGGSTVDSCHNVNVQGQTNNGNNAAAIS